MALAAASHESILGKEVFASAFFVVDVCRLATADFAREVFVPEVVFPDLAILFVYFESTTADLLDSLSGLPESCFGLERFFA